MRGCALAALGCLAVASAHAATFNVTNLNDSGAGSLRDAIAQANAAPGADTVTFGVTGTIVLTSGGIQIVDALTIQGPGPALLTVDGNANNRIFSIVEAGAPACPALTGPTDYPVLISGLTLRNGQRNVLNSVGGAIYTAKTLTVDDVTFDNNRARGGGAIWFAVQYAGQALTVTNSLFTGNQAKEIVAGSTLGHVGGAIGSAENCSARTQPVTITVADSVFTGNFAEASGVNARGGAIYFSGDADVSIARTTIQGNEARPPIVPNANVNSQGGGVSGVSMTLNVIDSTFAANVADRNVALHLFNDALARQTTQERMLVEVINSTFSGNRSLQTGTLLAYGNVELQLHNSTIVGNRSDQNRTGGISLSTGATVPASAANALPPGLIVRSSVLWNPLGVRDIAKDAVTLPGVFVVSSNDSIVGALCDSACGAGPLTLSGTGNQVGVDPLLGPLASNGGPTLTRLPQLGSPAVDTGSNVLPLADDQRGTGFPRTVGARTDAGSTEYAPPAQCEGFVDVAGSSAFCPSVAWMKNRGVTTGCGNGGYCPLPNVSRLAMAAFMQRFGAAVSGFAVDKAEGSGLVDFAAAPRVCVSDPIAPSIAPRHAVIDAVFAGLAGSDNVGRGNIVVSEDGGTTWLPPFQLFTNRATFRAGKWHSLHLTGSHDVKAGIALRYAVLMDVPGGGVGGVTDSTCRLRIRMQNSSGFTPS